MGAGRKCFSWLVTAFLVLVMIGAVAGCGRKEPAQQPTGDERAEAPRQPAAAQVVVFSNPVQHRQLATLSKTFAELSWSWSSDEEEEGTFTWSYEGDEKVEGQGTVRIRLESPWSVATIWLAEDDTAVQYEERGGVYTGEMVQPMLGMWFLGAFGFAGLAAESTLMFEVLPGKSRDHEWEVVSQRREQVGGLTVDVTRYLFTPVELDIFVDSAEFHLAVADFGTLQLMVEAGAKVKTRTGDTHFQWSMNRMIRR